MHTAQIVSGVSVSEKVTMAFSNPRSALRDCVQ